LNPGDGPGKSIARERNTVELARKLPFLAVVMALLTLSVGSLMISQGVVGAQTDPGVGTDAPVDDDDEDVDDDSGGDSGPLAPVTTPVDTNPANAGGTGLPPAAPIDGATGGPSNSGGVGGTAAGLPQTGSGGYLETGSANSTFYMLVSVVAMMGLAGSLVYARARSK
jgi:hypothetical protein